MPKTTHRPEILVSDQENDAKKTNKNDAENE